MTTKKGPVVWINGFPGSGKLTVATAVAALCQSVTLLDNHKLIDPVEARTPRSHPDYQQERKLYRELVLKRYVGNPVTFADLVIFTGTESTFHMYLPAGYGHVSFSHVAFRLSIEQ